MEKEMCKSFVSFVVVVVFYYFSMAFKKKQKTIVSKLFERVTPSYVSPIANDKKFVRNVWT